jgi:hypothetical protein
MARGKIATAFVGGGVVGGLVTKLSGADVRALLSQTLTGFGRFLRTQGQYASFAILGAMAFGGLAIWSINKLIKGKDEEIARIAANRDEFQKLFIDDWRSSNPEKGGKKK